MTWVVAHIKWLMILSGVLTFTMLYAAIAPHAALRATFGESVEGPVAELVVRNWGVLIGLIGVMLIYGAFHPPSRPLVLAVAALSKLTFIGLVLSHGGRFLSHQAGLSIAIDLVMVLVFIGYLMRHRRGRAT